MGVVDLRRGTLRIFLIVFLIVSTMGLAAVGTTFQTPVIRVGPSIITEEVGEAFTVDITIADITSEESLYGWEFRMKFNSSLLNATSIMEGPFLKSGGTTSWTIMPPKIDNYAGWVNASNAFFPYPPNGATGSGVLCNITFQVKAEGITNLHFNKTRLGSYDGTLPPGERILPIEHMAKDGIFAYPPLLRDVAVTSITASPASVLAGETVSINVTVENQGEATEIFNVTILYDSTDIETKAVLDLVPGGSETLGFSWNTKNVVEGNYTITAVTSEIDGETDIADNTSADVVVTVTAPLSAFPLELSVAIIIAVAAIFSGVFLYIRRRRSTKA